jgi:hypothetical protein
MYTKRDPVANYRKQILTEAKFVDKMLSFGKI